MPANYHCHSRFDDGHGELEEYVRAALGKGLDVLGFSAHAPVPFPCDWTMPAALLPEYLETVKRLQREFRGRIEILLGLEVDYIPGIISPASQSIQALGLDFTIGSVHFLGSLKSGGLWSVDGPVEELVQGLEETFAGNVRAAVEEYYRRLREMIRETTPDIIGHFDVVKKNNRDGRFFSEDSPWYRELVQETLAALAASPCILEVNTGGIVRNTSGMLYPSPWILRECLKRGMAVTVSSDAHRPGQLNGHFSQTFDLLRQVGIRETAQIDRDGRKVVPL